MKLGKDIFPQLEVGVTIEYTIGNTIRRGRIINFEKCHYMVESWIPRNNCNICKGFIVLEENPTKSICPGFGGLYTTIVSVIKPVYLEDDLFKVL